MKKLFFSVLALTIGAFSFIACDEKEELVDDKGREETPKDSTNDVLGIQQQQAIITRTVNGLAQAIDFTNLAEAVNIALYNVGFEYNWDAGIEAAAAQDPILARKIEAVKQMMESDEIDFDFESMYFEADIEFDPSIAVDTFYYYNGAGSYDVEYDTTFVLTPVFSNINHMADHFRINVTTISGDVFSLFLKGNSSDSNIITVVDSDTKQSKSISVPGYVQVALSLNGDNLIAANGEFSTDFEIVVKGTNEIEKDFEENDTVFTVSELYAYGDNLNLRGELLIDRYALTGNVVYAKENGFDIAATAKIAGQEVLSVNAKLDATLTSMINFADTTYAGLMAWAMDYQSVRGLSVDAVIGGGQIKVFAALNENPVKYQEILNPVISFVGGSQPDAESVAAMIAKFNEIFTGEIYFKGYDKPQATFRLAYEAPAAPGEELEGGDSDYDGSVMSMIMKAISNSGLKIVIDTYDAEGKAITVSFQEYFDGIDIKETGAIIAANFQQAFGPLIEMFKQYNEEEMFEYEEGDLIMEEE